MAQIRLNQVLSTEKHNHSNLDRRMTLVHKQLDKPVLLDGIDRSYQPDDEVAGERFPRETSNVQVRVDQVITDMCKDLGKVYDIVATKDALNADNKVDVTVDGVDILTQVTAPHLLWLEKRLLTLHEFVRDLPVLDQAKKWTQTGAIHRADEVQTAKTKKVPRNHVKAEATDKHPAQVEMYYEDVKVGTWTRVDFSGALPVERRDEIVDRVTKLLDAVGTAREEANSMPGEKVEEGKAILDFVFA